MWQKYFVVFQDLIKCYFYIFDVAFIDYYIVYYTI